MRGEQLPGEVLTHVPQMSLRDFFAGMALSGLTSAHDKDGNWTGDSTVDVQNEAHRIADKMMQAREK